MIEIPRALGLGGFYILLAQEGSAQVFLIPRWLVWSPVANDSLPVTA